MLNVDVEEKSTGEFQIGAGYSSTDGMVGQMSVSENNLMGRGQKLRLGVNLSGSTGDVNLSFTEPYFLGKNLSAGFDVFYKTNENDDSGYTENLIGGGLKFGYRITDELYQNWSYSYRQSEIDDIQSNASAVVRSEAGTTTRSILGHSVVYNTLDNNLFPREGLKLSMANSFAGLGGDVDYFRTVGKASFYQPIAEKYIFSLRGEAGLINGLGEDTRIADRFFMGGNKVRGFDTSGIGPRDASTGSSLGGTKYYRATTEVQFPFPFISDEIEVTGRVFGDAGALWDVGDDSLNGVNVNDDSSPRFSTGVGMTWMSPLGPLQLDYAWPISSEDYDKEENFRFSVGTRF